MNRYDWRLGGALDTLPLDLARVYAFCRPLALRAFGEGPRTREYRQLSQDFGRKWALSFGQWQGRRCWSASR